MSYPSLADAKECPIRLMVPVGDQASIVAAQGGPLRFKIQDTRYDDNQGAFTVDVIVIPAALIPPRREN